MSIFLQALVNGLNQGAIYALIALGYTMVYGILRMINFAHGDFIMVGAYTIFYTAPIMVSYGMPAWMAVLIAVVWPYRDHLQAISHALTLFMHGQPLALAAYSRVITVLLCSLFTSVGASLSKSEYAFFPLAFLTVFELMGISFLGLNAGPLTIVPLLAALLLTARLPGVSSLRLLPLAAAVLGLTLCLVPVASSTSAAAESSRTDMAS